jgi:hypothetical protein
MPQTSIDDERASVNDDHTQLGLTLAANQPQNQLLANRGRCIPHDDDVVRRIVGLDNNLARDTYLPWRCGPHREPLVHSSTGHESSAVTRNSSTASATAISARRRVVVTPLSASRVPLFRSTDLRELFNKTCRCDVPIRFLMSSMLCLEAQLIRPQNDICGDDAVRQRGDLRKRFVRARRATVLG